MRIAVAVLSCALGAVTARAGETGSISGVVKDSQGGVLPGATVRVSGPMLPAGRNSVSSDNGAYIFDQLLPGVYTVEATLTGLGNARRQVQVQVDRDTQVELVLSPTLAEEVTVTAEPPSVDLRSTEVNFNFTDEVIDDLPLDRSYKGLFQLVPGVAENRSTVGPSAGGSRQDNTYLIDGVNITNPGFGYLATEVNPLDIAEFNIKRGAVSAEFGRAAGFVANAVSKSGTNDFHGTARFDWMPQGFIGGFDEPAFRDTVLTTVVNPAIGLGGPLVHDKVFWYGSARYFRETKWDRVNRLNQPQPDEERSGSELYGKITSTPSQRHLLAVGYRYRPNEVDNAGIASDRAASVATDDDNSSRVATASWSFFATGRTVLEVKYLHLKEQNEAVPVTDLGEFPTWDPRNLAAMGQYPDPAQGNLIVGGKEYTNAVNYRRDEIRATLGQYFDLGKTGHQVKVGAGYEVGEEELLRTVNGWGILAPLTVSGQPRIRARYYPNQPAQVGSGRTYSLFAQDTINLTQRLTINAGVLLNRDEFVQDIGDNSNTFLSFGFGDEIQPRLGFNFNVRPGAGDKVYGNWGRYYNMDQKSSGRSLAPSRIFQREAFFDVAGNMVSDAPLASTTGKLLDPDLEPTYNDEWLFGYATPFGANWSVDAFFLYRDTHNFIEDVPSTLPTTGPFKAVNLPCTSTPSCQNANAQRTYKAVTVEVNRRLANRWSGNFSYTWSRLEGNFDLDYATVSVFNTSSILQDGPGAFIEDPNRFGPLTQDRTHIFKAFLNYVPIDALTLGGYLRVQSGTPWNARGRDRAGSSVLNYLEPAGARRNPTWTNIDLLANYRFRLGGRTSLAVEARVLNAFDSQTRLESESQQFLDLNTLPAPPWIGPYTQPNTLFGTGKAFAPPRRLLLSAMVDF
jgi:hypothetical protein